MVWDWCVTLWPGLSSHILWDANRRSLCFSDCLWNHYPPSAPQYTGNRRFFIRRPIKNTHVRPPLSHWYSGKLVSFSEREKETETHVFENKRDTKTGVGNVWETESSHAEENWRTIRWTVMKERHSKQLTWGHSSLVFSLPLSASFRHFYFIPCKHSADCRLSHTACRHRNQGDPVGQLSASTEPATVQQPTCRKMCEVAFWNSWFPGQSFSEWVNEVGSRDNKLSTPLVNKTPLFLLIWK